MKWNRSVSFAMSLGVFCLMGCAGRPLPIEEQLGLVEPGQTKDEVDAIIANARPTRRHVLSADRALLARATEEWLTARYDKLLFQDRSQGRFETHQIVFQTSGPLPVSTQISIQIMNHPELPKALVLEVLALDLQVDLASAASGPSTELLWRLQGNAPSLEQAIAEEIVERYTMLKEGLNPPLPPRQVRRS